MVRIGLIGFGYWGPNLARAFSETKGATLAAISDLNPARRQRAETRHPGVLVTEDQSRLIDHPEVDAIAIATPVSTHFPLAMAALKAGKHVLVAKPITASTEEASQLIDEAGRRGLVLMVDHTFLFSGAVRRIRDLVAHGELGDIHYYDSVRVNLGLFQHDVNVIWDLAVHDLSILDYVLPARPRAVSATGMSHVPGGPENIAYITLFFAGRVIGHVHVNWLAPVKIRRTLLGGSRRMVVYDDLEPSEKVKIYDCGVTAHDAGPESIYQILYDYRMGDMWAPQLDRSEPLAIEVAHFVECIETGRVPISDGHSGRRLVRILAAATESLRNKGARVELEPDEPGQPAKQP